LDQKYVSIGRSDGDPHLLDPDGRRLFLRGVNANGLIQYASDYQEEVPLAEDDFVEMEALGLNLLRLPVSWSRIMPEPDNPSHAYLEHIQAVIAMARNHRIYVIVDFHQDNYARNLAPAHESDGAPLWAVVTDWHWNWKMSGNPAVETAWSHFWHNDPVHGKGLEDHYLDAVLFVVKGLVGEPGVLAYDLMNEPDPGWAIPGYFEARYLFPWYTRAIARLRTVDCHHLILFEPSVIRDATNVAIQCSRPFSNDPNLIYGPHCYTEVASLPFRPVGRRTNPCLYACYLTAAMEAKGFGTPWLFGEFGIDATPAGDGWIQDQMRFQHQFGVGGAFWVWKQRPGFYGWGVVHPDGSLRTKTKRAQILAEPRVLAMGGRVEGVRYDVDRKTLTVRGRLGRGAPAEAVFYASGFAYESPPVFEVMMSARRAPVVSTIEHLAYPSVPDVHGWRIFLDLSQVHGCYQIVMRPG